MLSDITIYLGIPDLRPDFVRAARDLDTPIMLSAAAQSRRWTADMMDADEPHPGFNPVPNGRLDGVRCALDSMGFSAMALKRKLKRSDGSILETKWGGYPVTPEQYIRLAASHQWDFWASQDLCCEPEVADNQEQIVARIMETGARYDELCYLAEVYAIPKPMKVLQGWGWWHYIICAETLDVTSEDALVGIGSVCKRQRNGLSGVVTIIDRLDQELPKGVKFHLFGVTSDALEELSAHPRVASMDSMAWAAALRRNHQTGRTNALAIEYMAKFYRAQQAHIRRGGRGFPSARSLPLRPPPIWKGRSEEYRRKAAEVLHGIRNGQAEAVHYAITMETFGGNGAAER